MENKFRCSSGNLRNRTIDSILSISLSKKMGTKINDTNEEKKCPPRLASGLTHHWRKLANNLSTQKELKNIKPRHSNKEPGQKGVTKNKMDKGGIILRKYNELGATHGTKSRLDGGFHSFLNCKTSLAPPNCHVLRSKRQ